jgi:hypothetical protein
LGFVVWGLGFRIEGLWYGFNGFEFRVWSLGFMVGELWISEYGYGFMDK